MANTEGTACAQVLATPELLENILLGLSIKDLLLSQRTCSTFKGCVAESPKLKRRLFLATQKLATQKQVAHDYNEDLNDLNSLVVEVDRALSFINPRIKININGSSRLDFKLNNYCSPVSAFLVYPPFRSDEGLHLLETESASFLDMYLQSNPRETEIRTLKEDYQSRTEERGDWHAAFVTVNASTLRELLGSAIGLLDAADRLEKIEKRKGAQSMPDSVMGKKEMARPGDFFEWKANFSKAQLGMILGDPRIKMFTYRE